MAKPKVTSRKNNYRTSYEQDNMDEAVNAVKSGMTVKMAAAQFSVPRTTLGDRVAGRTKLDPGRPTQLSNEEEKILVERAMLLGSWGFPLTFRDFRELVKAYLDKTGRTTKFKNNLPSKHFVYYFMRRHPELSFRKANNIKRSRAGVSREEIQEFFAHFTKTVEGVPACNIWNYDETNLRDDPGTEKAIFKKGTKYAERVLNTSKSAISIMFCGSAEGEMMPPYVVYKAQNMYESWRRGGPKGTRYNCTKSGWFDSCVFTDWFTSCALPVLRRQQGKKVIVGDNLASHISDAVITLCKQNDVEFVCLPPNSTDKLQPLDVGYFAPMKAAWRKILLEFKLKNPREASIPKSEFPALLKCLVSGLNPLQHMPSAFRKCGLHPVDPEQVLQRIPHRLAAEEIATNVDASLLEKLEINRQRWAQYFLKIIRKFTEKTGTGNRLKRLQKFCCLNAHLFLRYGSAGGAGIQKKTRGKKLKVAAGRSYTSIGSDEEDLEDVEADEEDEDNVEMDNQEADEEESEESDLDMDSFPTVEPVDCQPRASSSNTGRKFTPGSYVVATYEREWYVAQVEDVQDNVATGYTRLRYMAKKGRNRFMWEKPDILSTLDQDILMKVPPPVPVTTRFMGVSEAAAKQADKLLLVYLVLIFLILQNLIQTFTVFIKYLRFLLVFSFFPLIFV
jgi:DDE superfamily endonuclease/helix-turn-helix, Psq domain